MAMIPRAALDYVTEQINGLSADAQAKVLKVLQALDWKPDDADNVAACRQAVVEALASIMPTYADAAAQASADFYDATREMMVGEPLGAQAISGYDPRKTEGAVRGFVRFVLEDRVDAFNDQVLQRIDYETKRAAGASMIENGKRDPLKPRYARVPTGSETCAFCIMLASRGFVYHTEGTAGAVGHYHANCDCRIVCGWDAYASGVSRRRAADVEVEGYDMDALYDQYVEDLRSGRLKLDDVAKTTSHVQNWKSEDFKSYKDFADFIDGAKDIEDLQYRCAVVEQERGKTGLSDSCYNRLRQRVSSRRGEITGRPSAIGSDLTASSSGADYSLVPGDSFGKMLRKSDSFDPSDYDPENIVDRGREWRDLFAHDALDNAGYSITPRPANAPDGFSNIDSFVNAKLFEIKSPEEPDNPPKPGRELAFVESNLRSAKRQFHNQFDESTGEKLDYDGPVRVVFSSRYRNAEDDKIRGEISRQMEAHEIDEVLFVKKDGSVESIER